MGKTFYVKNKILREIIEIFSYMKFLKFNTPNFFQLKVNDLGKIYKFINPFIKRL